MLDVCQHFVFEGTLTGFFVGWCSGAVVMGMVALFIIK